MANGSNLEKLHGGRLRNISYGNDSQHNSILGGTEKQISGYMIKFYKNIYGNHCSEAQEYMTPLFSFI